MGSAPVVFPFKFVFVHCDHRGGVWCGEGFVLGKTSDERKAILSVGKGFENPLGSRTGCGAEGVKKIDGIVNSGFVLRSGGKSRYKANRPSGNMIRVIDLEGQHFRMCINSTKTEIEDWVGAPSIFRIQRNQISPMTTQDQKPKALFIGLGGTVKRHFTA